MNDMSQVIAVMALIMAIEQLVDRMVFEKLENGIRRKWGLVSGA
jgi:hypothetical protein